MDILICFLNNFWTLGIGQTENTQIRVFVYFQFDHSRSRKLIPKAYFKWECPYYYKSGVTEGPKGLYKGPCTPLECSLRPHQATQMTPGPLWTRQNIHEAFLTSNKNLVTWKLFSFDGAPQFTEPLKWLSTKSRISANLSHLQPFPAIQIVCW